MVKVTFTLDDHTVARLRQAAERLNKPQSQVVREAVRDYADRVGRLSEHERLRMLSALDAIVKRKPTRSTAACAIAHGASLWTLNREDFADIPDLVLAEDDKKRGDP